MRLFSVIFLILIFLYALYRERFQITEYFSEIGIAMSLFCLISFLVGYLVPYLFGVSEKQARACTFEVGIHNTGLALTIALSVLSNTTIAIPAGIYTIFMYIFAFAFGFILTQKPQLLSKTNTRTLNG
jgi:BASS family bile acid:Na+ symporter